MLQLPDTPGYPLDLTFSGNAVYAFACVSNTHFQVKNMQGGSLEITDNFFYGLGSIIKAGGTAHDIDITFTGNTLAGAIGAGPFNIGPTGKVGLWSGIGHQLLHSYRQRLRERRRPPRRRDGARPVHVCGDAAPRGHDQDHHSALMLRRP